MIDRLRLCIFLLFMLAFGCKEEVDDEPPIVDFISPEANESYQVNDSIPVILNITDNSLISSVVLSLVEENETPAGRTYYFTPDSSSFRLEMNYPLDNTALSTGKYYLQVLASDANVDNKTRRSVNITEIPKELLNFIAITPSGTNTTDIRVYTPDFEPDTTIFLTMSYYTSSVSGSHKKLLYVPAYLSRLYAFETIKYQEEWIIEAPFPYSEFYHLVCDYLIYASTGNAEIWGYDRDGNVSFQTEAKTNFMILNFNISHDYVFAACVPKTPEDLLLALYYRGTGVQKKSWTTETVITGIESSGNNFLLIVNDGTDVKALEVETEELNLTEKAALENNSAHHTLKIDDRYYLVQCDNGIYRYDHDLIRFELFLDGIQSSKMVYEDLDRNIYLIAGDDILVYAYPGGFLAGSFSPGEEILDFHILYNK